MPGARRIWLSMIGTKHVRHAENHRKKTNVRRDLDDNPALLLLGCFLVYWAFLCSGTPPSEWLNMAGIAALGTVLGILGGW